VSTAPVSPPHDVSPLHDKRINLIHPSVELGLLAVAGSREVDLHFREEAPRSSLQRLEREIHEEWIHEDRECASHAESRGEPGA